MQRPWQSRGWSSTCRTHLPTFDFSPTPRSIKQSRSTSCQLGTWGCSRAVPAPSCLVCGAIGASHYCGAPAHRRSRGAAGHEALPRGGEGR